MSKLRPKSGKLAALTVSLTLIASLQAVSAGETLSASKPNVLLVLTDDQGYGDLGCHGNPVLKTPYLDRLHDESVRFIDFHATPMCTPTRGSLLTGRDPLDNGAYCVSSGRTFIRRGIPTMAEIFASSGYRTAVFGKWHLGDNYPHRPTDRGFQTALYHLGWGITSTPDYWNNDYEDDTFRVGLSGQDVRLQPCEGYCTDVFTDACGKWIRESKATGRPFFAYLSFNAPHGPFYVPESFREPYKHLDADTAGFFGMIANLDANLARLDALLEAEGLRENTILIFMTDNGGTGGVKVFNAGMRGAKTSLYEGGHRVPLFVRWPGGKLRSAGEVAALTQVQDVLPTLIDLCGLAPPANAGFDGVSLGPLLRGDEAPAVEGRKLVVQYGGLVDAAPKEWDCAVMSGPWRLVRGQELYNVADDPAQERDVAAAHSDRVAALRAHYERWWSEVEPGLAKAEAIVIGSDAENPATLTALDWLAPRLTPAAQPFDIRQLGRTVVVEGSLPLGRPQPQMTGFWNVEVDQAGEYEIAVRRWPKEADAAITAPLPEYQGTLGSYPAGLALPAARAQLRVGDIELAVRVDSDEKAAVFQVSLPAGAARLETAFFDAKGKELVGGFYVEVRRK